MDVSGASPTCIPGREKPLGKSPGLDISKRLGSRAVELNLRLAPTYHKMPSCLQSLEFTPLGGHGDSMAWISVEGHLIQESGAFQYRHSEFCVDHTAEGVLGALTCPACTKVTSSSLKCDLLCRSTLASTFAAPTAIPWYLIQKANQGMKNVPPKLKAKAFQRGSKRNMT